ncbi:MAG: hypothetical protein FJZ00_10975 [Candidatus Sericytochromatia bacterium]|uniref:Uncharacterized protein n=1 Tax=Candidatus Tanganyikabacteria bacterium TaxID=2961651 RepID=A0A937X7D7_9BACT|nr:hypothetical protein [Candidatus Tanganyikabacteria bacterium]
MLPQERLSGKQVEIALRGRPRQYGIVFSDLENATAIKLDSAAHAYPGDQGSFHVVDDGGLTVLSGEVVQVYGHFVVVAFKLQLTDDRRGAGAGKSALRAAAPLVKPEDRRKRTATQYLGDYWINRRIATQL